MAQHGTVLQEVVAVRFSREDVKALQRAARDADRSLSAEIRRRVMRTLSDTSQEAAGPRAETAGR